MAQGPVADALTPGCPLCTEPGGLLVWSGDWMRLIRADDALHPAFYRLVWQHHAREFTDLTPLQRSTCMDALALVEQGLRTHLAPDKINLASLGNIVPHLHWHVIARWGWDAHWPQPVWAAAQRTPADERLAAVRAHLPALDASLRAALHARFGSRAQAA
uniref:Putative Histidine triad (HIT) hydrolase n=1 Tax=mine drainage metagenome TaxID=410659 RepID=E6PVA9_9ZZZZ